jgi:hypothetical protein
MTSVSKALITASPKRLVDNPCCLFVQATSWGERAGIPLILPCDALSDSEPFSRQAPLLQKLWLGLWLARGLPLFQPHYATNNSIKRSGSACQNGFQTPITVD